MIKYLLLYLLGLVFCVHLCAEPNQREVFKQFDDEFSAQIHTLTQAEMLERKKNDPMYAKWLETTAWDGVKIRAGNLEIAQNLIKKLSDEREVNFETQRIMNSLMRSGNPDVILLLEDYLKKTKTGREAYKSYFAQLIISELVYYSPELTNFLELPRISGQPFNRQRGFVHWDQIPWGAWIRWFDANKEYLQKKDYKNVKLFSYYCPVLKNGGRDSAGKDLPFYLDSSYEPNSAPIDMEKIKEQGAAPPSDSEKNESATVSSQINTDEDKKGRSFYVFGMAGVTCVLAILLARNCLFKKR